MASTFNMFDCLVEDLAENVHDFASHQFCVALSNVEPDPADTILTDINEIAYTYVVNEGTGARDLTLVSSAQADGVYSVDFEDLTLTASGGNVGTFRYVVIYNDDSADDSLVCWYDVGEDITLASGEMFQILFNESGLFSISLAV
jgi:hypothetical protein